MYIIYKEKIHNCSGLENFKKDDLILDIYTDENNIKWMEWISEVDKNYGYNYEAEHVYKNAMYDEGDVVVTFYVKDRNFDKYRRNGLRFENGMKAVISNIIITKDDKIRIKFDFSQFNKHNSKLHDDTHKLNDRYYNFNEEQVYIFEKDEKLPIIQYVLKEY